MIGQPNERALLVMLNVLAFQYLAHLLYASAREYGCVDPHRVEEILGLTERELPMSFPQSTEEGTKFVPYVYIKPLSEHDEEGYFIFQKRKHSSRMRTTRLLTIGRGGMLSRSALLYGVCCP